MIRTVLFIISIGHLISLTFSHLKADGRGKENVKEAGLTFGFGSDDHGPIDLSIPSNGTSQGTGEWNLVFDFKPSSFAPDDLFSGSYSISKKNDADTGSHVSQDVKNVDSNGNFSHFKDAYSEPQLMPLSVSQLLLASFFFSFIIKICWVCVFI